MSRRGGLNFNRKRRKLDIKFIPKTILTIIEVAAVIMLAYLSAYSYGLQTTVIGDSMSPTVMDGDTVLLDRLRYRIVDPKAGDVVAFRAGGRLGASISIKRVMAVPGDSVYISGGKVFVNDVVVEEYDRANIVDAGMAENKIYLGDDEYFILGDNRNHSTDSRYVSVGNISRDFIIGKVWCDVTRGSIGLVN